MSPINYDFPCKKCGHNYEDHPQGGGYCAICWANDPNDYTLMCYGFLGDNLKWLRDKYENKQE